MGFSSFIIDEEEGEKKRRQIEAVIKKAVKKQIISVTETEDTTNIKFKAITPGVKEMIYEVIVTIDYYKQVYRGVYRAVYINTIKQSNSYKESDYLQVDVHAMNDVEYAKALEGIKTHFEKLAGKEAKK